VDQARRGWRGLALLFDDRGRHWCANVVLTLRGCARRIVYQDATTFHFWLSRCSTRLLRSRPVNLGLPTLAVQVSGVSRKHGELRGGEEGPESGRVSRALVSTVRWYFIDPMYLGLTQYSGSAGENSGCPQTPNLDAGTPE